MVRAHQIKTGVPRPTGRPAGGDGSGSALRGSGFLTPEQLKAALIARARAAGFDAVRVTSPSAIPDAPSRLRDWLGQGYQGDMAWMEERTSERSNPAALWSDVRSIIMLGINYAPDTNPLDDLIHADTGTISAYARRRDYHDVIKGRLKTIASLIPAKGGALCKVFVDTAPVMEKPLAQAAGLGWQGKHSVLVSRDHGSWLLLGAIYTSAELPADEPETDHCGTCTRCLDICPTAAFPQPYMLDSRRCIAYLTIEHAGPIEREFRQAIGNRIFGCDDCLAVCPWNKFAKDSHDLRLALRDDLHGLKLSELATLDDAGFRRLFAGTPVKRTGRDRFLRNVLIAIGNSADRDLVGVVMPLLDDNSPLVRGMAVWALARLDAVRATQEAHGRAGREPDAHVCAEWNMVLREHTP
jgi:epoxyqueuosine reductase